MPKEEAMTKKELLEELAQLREQVRQLKVLETDFKTIEQELRCSELQFRGLFENAQHGIVILDGDTGQVKNANRHILDMLGYSSEELVGTNLWEIEAFIDTEKSQAVSRELKDKNHIHCADFPLETRNGRRLDVEIESTVCSVNSNRIVYCNIRDISGYKRLDKELRLIATHDTMTGLPNRSLFLDRARIALIQAQRRKKKVAIMSLDIDKFSAVNETLGNNVGDKLLKAFAERLAKLLRQSDTVARVGGDEFALVLPDIDNVDHIAIIAEKLVEAFRHQFIISGRRIIVTISIGVSVYPDDGKNIEILLNSADKSMYFVRANGCNHYQMSRT